LHAAREPLFGPPDLLHAHIYKLYTPEVPT